MVQGRAEEEADELLFNASPEEGERDTRLA
jgi:hypothetical protein